MDTSWVLLASLFFVDFSQSVTAHSRDPWIQELLRLNRHSQCPSQITPMAKAWNDNELNSVEEAPAQQANVIFSREGQPDYQLKDIAEILTPTIVQHAPKVTWPAQEGQLYAVLMTDPDAPSRQNPKFGEWYHWGVLNIPGNDISKGDVIAEYVGAGPPKGTGLHRYVILVYQQQCRIDTKGEKIGLTTDGRPSHKAKQIAAERNLGKPIAGACFQAEWDDYVPKLYQKLG